MRSLWSCLVAIILIVIPGSAAALAANPYTGTGIDVSWPNCKVIAHAVPKTSFAVVGVNDGLDFTGSPCIALEAQSFPDYSLYLSTGYPGINDKHAYQVYPKLCAPTDTVCFAYNYGFNAARYSVDYAALHDVHSTKWWLDVETVNSWSSNPYINVALKQLTFLASVGFYAYPGQWKLLTGSWKNDTATWAATGTYSRTAARKACSQPSFTGGNVVLTQYTLKLDQDFTC
jgi:hypothetical protein